MAANQQRVSRNLGNWENLEESYDEADAVPDLQSFHRPPLGKPLTAETQLIELILVYNEGVLSRSRIYPASTQTLDLAARGVAASPRASKSFGRPGAIIYQ